MILNILKKKKITIIFLIVLLIKSFLLIINLAKQLFFTEVKMQFIKIQWWMNILMKISLCLQNMKQGFSQAISDGYVINYLILEIKKEGIIVMWQENIDVLLIEVVMLILNWLKKFLEYFIISYGLWQSFNNVRNK